MAKILVVDDSPIIHRLLTGILEQGKHQVVACAFDGNDAFEKYAQFKPDLVIMDVTMPNCDGREGLKKIKVSDPSARVLMLSALIQPEIAQACMKIGAAGFHSKDLLSQPEQLLNLVAQALSRKAA